jgi:hypothetical protein
MSRFLAVCGVLVVTYLGFFFYPTTAEGKSPDEIAGMPVVCQGVGSENPLESGQACWLTLGAGRGIVVVGMGGVGVVCFVFYGLGILFATGQLAAGGIAFGQVGLGLSFFFGQAGVAPVAMGQVVGGAQVVGQGALGPNGGPFLKQLSAELNRILGSKKAFEAPPDES